MACFDGEVIRDARGREVVRFTTSSGVRAVFATDISDEALKKFARSLRRKLARSQARLAAKPTGGRPNM
jgi:predicted RNase H-like nuclease (RuvC/YqgF family)